MADRLKFLIQACFFDNPYGTNEFGNVGRAFVNDIRVWQKRLIYCNLAFRTLVSGVRVILNEEWAGFVRSFPF